MKNKLWLLLVKLLKKRTPNSGTQNILVISTTALGDTLWATPSLESLRKSHPKATIAILTNSLGEEALRHNPWVDRIYVHKNFFSSLYCLRKERFTDIVLFHASQRFVLPLAAMLGASRIVGTEGINKGLDTLLTHPICNQKEHEIIRRLQLIEQLDAKGHSETLSFFLQTNERIDAFKGISVALHPGSKDAFKRWPKEHFIAVGKELRKMGVKVFVTGTKEEGILLKEIGANIPEAKVIQDLPLRGFAAFLEKMQLLICNDTGPVHLASALNTPVIALYSSTNPHLCGPHKAEKTLALFRPPTCSPCLKRKCSAPFCLMQIGPEEVVAKAYSKIFSHKHIGDKSIGLQWPC